MKCNKCQKWQVCKKWSPINFEEHVRNKRCPGLRNATAAKTSRQLTSFFQCAAQLPASAARPPRPDAREQKRRVTSTCKGALLWALAKKFKFPIPAVTELFLQQCNKRSLNLERELAMTLARTYDMYFKEAAGNRLVMGTDCLLYTSPSPRD